MQKPLHNTLFKKYKSEITKRHFLLDRVQALLPGYLSHTILSVSVSNGVLTIFISDSSMYFQVFKYSQLLLTKLQCPTYQDQIHKVAVCVRPDMTNTMQEITRKPKTVSQLPKQAVKHFSKLLNSLKNHAKLAQAVRNLVDDTHRFRT
ncbi:MAG: hypothetical protein VX112_04505 [Pseudomonadota bacterium]|nr:hypothetical protein [Pseudomonadota bacterium]